MRTAQVLVVAIGILLPYLARLPRGWSWVSQYSEAGVGAWMLLGAFNAIAWGAVLWLAFIYRYASSILAPAIPGFGFLAFAHYGLDLSSDAQAAIALLFIPVYALVPIGIGGVVGYLIDRSRRLRLSGRGDR